MGGALEGAAQVAKGQLQQFSEQQFVDWAADFGNFGCNGGMMDMAFDYAKQAALCTEESYPYSASDDSACQAASCDSGLEAGELVGYVDVGHQNEDLMSAL